MKSCALLLSLLLTLAGCPAWAEDEIVTGPDRRREIDVRIEALDAKRAEISTENPKLATALGGVMLVGGVAAAFPGFVNDCVDSVACTPFSGATIAGLTLLSIGTVTTLAGGVIWNKRANRRDEIDAERESLIEERDGLADALSRLELRSPYRNRTQFVTLGVRF